MKENGGIALLWRMLLKVAQAARAIGQLNPSPPTTTPPATPFRLPPSLLDCTDDDDAASPSFHTASSTPTEIVHSRLTSPGAVEADIDRRAAEFIKRFRRNASLELRYCSPMTPARSPMSPDTYFNLWKQDGAVLPVHEHGSPVHTRPAYRRVSPRLSGTSIKWPNSPYLTRRPSVEVQCVRWTDGSTSEATRGGGGAGAKRLPPCQQTTGSLPPNEETDASPEVIRRHFVTFLIQLYGWSIFSATHVDTCNAKFIDLTESLVDVEFGAMPRYS